LRRQAAACQLMRRFLAAIEQTPPAEANVRLSMPLGARQPAPTPFESTAFMYRPRSSTVGCAAINPCQEPQAVCAQVFFRSGLTLIWIKGKKDKILVQC